MLLAPTEKVVDALEYIPAPPPGVIAGRIPSFNLSTLVIPPTANGEAGIVLFGAVKSGSTSGA